MPTRKPLALLAALATFGLVSAVAQAAGGVALGAQSVTASPCTQAGLRTSLGLDQVTVRAVSVAGFPKSCLGQSLSVVLTRAGGGDLATSGSVTGATTTLTVPPGTDVRDVSGISVVVAG
jgi:hypothetical protein